MFYTQSQFHIRCEWGLQAIQHLEGDSDVIIIVDVLSFSTCVDVAVSNGAFVFPYRWHDDSAQAFADKNTALLASKRQESTYSLSPSSLQSIPAGTKLVLPSPNGATLSLATSKPTLAGCFRNAAAVAQAAMSLGERITVIPAGERWSDGSLRPAIEDWLGAGAIIAQINGTRSPESALAELSFTSTADHLAAVLLDCASGRELIELGYAHDVELAVTHNVSRCAPALTHVDIKTAFYAPFSR